MRNLQRIPERIGHYPDEVQEAARYIAENLKLAEQQRGIALTLPGGPRRDARLNIAETANLSAAVASEVLGMLHEPPQSETWIEAIRSGK